MPGGGCGVGGRHEWDFVSPVVACDFYWVAGYTVVVFGLAVLVFRRRMYE
ncbi:MAG: hypothetical protein PVG83_02640 [Acidimicrobiia bacterium]